MYCEHNHLINQCEVCSYAAAVERGDIAVRQQVLRPTLRTDDTRPRVSEDTVIERSDLGEGVETLVVAGEAVPLGLEDLPRAPRVKPPPATKPARRRQRQA